MRKLKLTLFFVFLGIYAAGLIAGGLGQVRSGGPEIFDYLSGAMAEYAPSAAEGIKAAAAENARLLAVLALGGLFKAGAALILAAMAFKGYAAGFSITAAVRLYGAKGLLVCGANLLSAAILIPAAAYYGCAACANALLPPSKKSLFLKKYFIILIFLTAIFCADSVLRGFFSATFMKLSAFFTKTA